jgi:glycosyltransferase involved in cell wall biosynthesis
LQIELLVSRYKRMIGLARYTASLKKYLSRIGVEYKQVEPDYPLLLRAAHTALRPLGYDVKEFFNIYPVSAGLHQNTVKHFTHQLMGSMLATHRDLSPVIITVHDIVPYLMRDDPEQCEYHHFYDRWVDNRAMHSLRRADFLISISEYTKKMLVEHLGCAADKIQVILYGLDHEIFRPLPGDDAFRARYQLDPGCRYLLYVGSENPRKNLPRLVEAFAQVRSKFPNIRLLKVGTPENLEHYQKLQRQIHALELDEAIRFINHPPQEDLVRLYSAADVFVFPSLFEGFGMPPLEAMACGAPVVCSNAASLPEVVGDAAITLDPLDIQGWADAIVTVLQDQDLSQDMRRRSIAWAGQFTWERNAHETLKVYEQANQLLR